MIAGRGCENGSRLIKGYRAAQTRERFHEKKPRHSSPLCPELKTPASSRKSSTRWMKSRSPVSTGWYRGTKVSSISPGTGRKSPNFRVSCPISPVAFRRKIPFRQCRQRLTPNHRRGFHTVAGGALWEARWPHRCGGRKDRPSLESGRNDAPAPDLRWCGNPRPPLRRRAGAIRQRDKGHPRSAQPAVPKRGRSSRWTPSRLPREHQRRHVQIRPNLSSPSTVKIMQPSPLQRQRTRLRLAGEVPMAKLRTSNPTKPSAMRALAKF